MRSSDAATMRRPARNQGGKMEGHRLAPAFAACLALVAAAASAQPPATPPPPAGGGGQTGPRYHELLPDIGLIGAQVGAAIGVSQNPYQAGTGWEVAGFIDL